MDSLQPAMSEGESRLQTARVRFAWTACKSLLDQEQTAASQPAPPDEEEQLLPATELDALKEAFYKRYHLRPPPSKFPNDRLISKMVRALSRNQLEVFDLWNVRSLVHQRTHGAKKRRLAENIFIHEDDKEEQAPRNWLTYLDKLETYLFALAIAGVSQSNSAGACYAGIIGHRVGGVCQSSTRHPAHLSCPLPGLSAQGPGSQALGPLATPGCGGAWCVVGTIDRGRYFGGTY